MRSSGKKESATVGVPLVVSHTSQSITVQTRAEQQLWLQTTTLVLAAEIF